MKILIIEDELEINNILKEYLTEYGYEIEQAFDGAEALLKFDSSFDLLIVDVMMPVLDGFSFMKEIRKSSSVPVIMLTALGDEENTIKGYDLGVDEYVSKPFSPRVIVKKVEAMLRRDFKADVSLVKRGILSLNKESMEIKLNGDVLSLSRQEFELLSFFMNHEKVVFNREQLLDQVWGYDYYGEDRVVDSSIKRLRKKLSNCDYIKTVFGVGYKFEVTDEA